MPNENDSRPLVLIVEDYDDTSKLLSIALQLKNFRVITAANGDEGIKKALAARPNVILMDIHMPVLDGLAATRWIRRHIELQQTPIIAFSAYGEFMREQALAAGCDDYIETPCAPEFLISTIERFLRA